MEDRNIKRILEEFYVRTPHGNSLENLLGFEDVNLEVSTKAIFISWRIEI